MARAMIWTDEEIIRSYRTAANPKKQIGILAELNACDPSVIRAVLQRAGIIEAKQKKKRMKSTEFAKIRQASGFYPHCRIMLDDGVQWYTISEIAQRHGKSKTYMTRHTSGCDTCCIDGVTYKVRRSEDICG